MFNRILAVVLLVALIGSGITGYFVYDQKQEINSLVQQLSEAQQENAATAANLASASSSLGTQLIALKNDSSASIAGLQENIAESQTSLETRIDTTEASISSLGSNISSLTSTVNGITPGLAADSVFSSASKAVVEMSDGEDIIGTGFIYDTHGHVVTAAHIIKGMTDIYVILSDGMVSKASVTGQALRSDIAVLKLEKSTAIAPVTMAAVNSVAVGDYVLAVGHPFGLNDSLTPGVVSQLHRFVNVGTSSDERWLAGLIQFDAGANPGNSGGPLFNAKGEVIGMVVAGINPLYGSSIGLAVSGGRIKYVVDVTIAGLELHYPALMVWVEDITPEKAASLGRETIRGALVLGTMNPLETDGIQTSDIITAIDSTTINGVSELASYVNEQAKFVMTVHVLRGTEKKDITIRLSGLNEYEYWISTRPSASSTMTPSPPI